MPEQPTTPGSETPRIATMERVRLQTVLLGIIAFAVILFLLVQARFILISLAIAIILFSLTSAAINAIARLRIGSYRITNWLATAAAMALIATGLLTLTSLVLGQVNTVIVTTLSYTERASVAIAELFSFMGDDVSDSVLAAIRSVDVSSWLRAAAGQAGNLMSASVLVILFVGFLFAERVWFTPKLVSLMKGDAEQAERVQRIIGSIIRRVNHYLLVKTAVSAVTGLMVYGAMRAFELDLAEAMGVLTFILNYIPNIGSIIATLLVGLVAFVQLAEPGPTLVIFLVTAAIQFLNGNIIDPWLMGRALRLSSFGIIISLAFWGAVWGIPGMFLSVPIMVGLMIVCSYIPVLRPIAVMLSREGLPDTEHDARDMPVTGRAGAAAQGRSDAQASAAE